MSVQGTPRPGNFPSALEKMNSGLVQFFERMNANMPGWWHDLWGDTPGRAEGGPVLGGRAYMVGERGPELFIPHMNGQIINSATTSSIVHNYNYAPTYGNAPASPSADFAMMRAVVGVGG